jgi:predicted amidophosphoribosyltransferase
MGHIHLLSNHELPLMSYRVCLQCGLKTLVYPNSLCPRCLLLMKLHALEVIAKERKG